MRPCPIPSSAGRLAALLPAILAAGLALACQPGAAPAGSAALQPASSATVQPAAAQTNPPQPAAAEGTASSGEAEAPCYRVLPLDEKRRKLECKNGDRFTIGLAADGKWYPEVKVRAGLVPGYESPEAAGKALCACQS